MRSSNRERSPRRVDIHRGEERLSRVHKISHFGGGDGSRRRGSRGTKAPPGTTLHLREKVGRMKYEGREGTVVVLKSWLATEPSEEPYGLPRPRRPWDLFQVDFLNFVST